jgi:hypothetical protein
MSWGRSSDEVRHALKNTVVPVLRARGFKGSFPHFSRSRADRLDLLTFQFSQFGPDLYVEIASCGPSGVTLNDGSVIPPRKVRTNHVGLLRRRIGPQPSMDFASVDSPDAASLFVEQVMFAIEREGELWWMAPKGILDT